MYGLKELVKNNKIDLLLILICAVFPFCLLRSLLYCIIASISLVFLSIIALYYCNKANKVIDIKLAKLNFLKVFFSGIYQGEGSEYSYNQSVKYLVGFYDFPDYNKFLESEGAGFNLGKYDNYLKFVLSQDKENTAHILNYYLIIRNLIKDIDDLECRRRENIGQFSSYKILVILMFLLLSILFLSFPNLFLAIDKIIYKVVICISIGISLPCLYFSNYRCLKEIAYEK